MASLVSMSQQVASSAWSPCRRSLSPQVSGSRSTATGRLRSKEHPLEPTELSYDDLMKIVKRNHYVRDQLVQRVSVLLAENLELTAIIQEMQEALATTQLVADRNGDATNIPNPGMPADVASS